MFVSAQPVLMGTLSYTACFFTYCISSSRAFQIKAGSNPPPLISPQYYPSRIEFSSCTICPPSLPSTAPLQYLGSQVDAGLCSTRQVHHGGCVPWKLAMRPPLRSCPKPDCSPDLLICTRPHRTVCTCQIRRQTSDASLADQPQYFTLIFWIAEVFYPFSLAAWVEAQGCHPSHPARCHPLLAASCGRLSTQDFLNLVLPVHS